MNTSCNFNLLTSDHYGTQSSVDITLYLKYCYEIHITLQYLEIGFLDVLGGRIVHHSLISISTSFLKLTRSNKNQCILELLTMRLRRKSKFAGSVKYVSTIFCSSAIYTKQQPSVSQSHKIRFYVKMCCSWFGCHPNAYFI